MNNEFFNNEQNSDQKSRQSKGRGSKSPLLIRRRLWTDPLTTRRHDKVFRLTFLCVLMNLRTQYPLLISQKYLGNLVKNVKRESFNNLFYLQHFRYEPVGINIVKYLI